MRLRSRLPEVCPDEYEILYSCLYGCGRRYFALHKCWRKAVAEPDYHEVILRRYKCPCCGRSYRVHPTATTRREGQRCRPYPAGTATLEQQLAASDL